jgi:catechol 2,3-dioxygenase-like lactoylglutathione lyase family enzyme
MAVRLNNLVPMLQASDMQRTIDWYVSVLGFECVARMGNDWCRLKRDNAALMFMRNAHLGAPHATATQYIEVDDVMQLWRSIGHHVSAEWGPEPMSYGMLEFAIKDPDGYLLSFGQRAALPASGEAP